MSRISDECLYEQLSEDWRSRDRITWQIPAVLAVVGGLLLATIFGRVGGLDIDNAAKDALLVVGYVFAFLLVLLLARNLYLQAVGADLMQEIKRGGKQLEEARIGARRVPFRRKDFSFRAALGRIGVTIMSCLLFLFCAFITGVFFFFLLGNHLGWGLFGGLIPIAVALGILWLSHKCQKVSDNDSGNYMPNVTAQLRQDLEARHTIVGTMFRDIRTLKRMDRPLRLAKRLGYRFVVIDNEHKAFDEETLDEYADIAHRIGISLWIRSAQLDDVPISRYADIGFSGFMIPNAIDASRVLRIIDQAYFGPIAREEAHIRRGYSTGPVVLDGQRFENIRQEMDYANMNMVVALQTEHPEGMERLEELVRMDGIIGTIVGPNDLAVNLSLRQKSPNLTRLNRDEMYVHEEMIRAYERISQITQDSHKVAGIHFAEVSQMNLVERLVSQYGYRLILLGTEANFTHRRILETKRRIERIHC